MTKKHKCTNLILFIIVSNLLAVNNLSVREDVSHPRVRPGYIDEAISVVEPYGAYTEQLFATCKPQ